MRNLFAALAVLCACAAAIQVRQHIGADLLSAYPATESTAVLSRQSVAFLSTQTGHIQWRHTAGPREEFTAFSVLPKYIATLKVNSGDVSVVALFNIDGSLRWEVRSAENVVDLALFGDANNDGIPDVAVLGVSGSVAAMSGVDGALLWRMDKDKFDGFGDWSVLFKPKSVADGQSLVVVAGVDKKDGTLRAALVSGSSGQLVKKVAMDDARCDAAGGAHVLLDGEKGLYTVYCGSVEQKSVCSVKFAENTQDVMEIIPSKAFEETKNVPVASAVNVVAKFEKDVFPAFVSCPASAQDLSTALAVSEQSSKLYRGETAVALDDLSLRKNGKPVTLYTENSASRFILVQFEDGSIHMIDLAESRILWTREEALSDITQTIVLTPPAAADDSTLMKEYVEGTGTIVEQYLRRLRYEKQAIINFVARVKEFFATTDIKEAAKEYAEFFVSKLRQEQTATKEVHKNVTPVKDTFGLNKIIVAATRKGKLFGLLTEGGNEDIMWSNAIDNEANIVNPPAETQFLHTLCTATECGFPVVAFVRVWKDRTQVFRFNGLTGEKICSQEFPFAADQSVVLPMKDLKGRRILALLEKLNAKGSDVPSILVHVAGRSSNLKPGDFDKISFFLVDKDNGSVAGYKVDAAEKDHENDGEMTEPKKPFVAHATWVFALPSNEHVESVAFYHPNDMFHKASVVFGNGRIRAKYLNRNAFALATVSSEDVLTVYVIDSVSGKVITHVAHERSSGPVNMVITDNSVIYHFWSVEQYRVGAIDLFEETANWRQRVFNHDAPVDVEVETKTFNFPYGVDSMAVTVSAHGMTRKSIIMGLSEGRVYAMDRMLASPRRPRDTERNITIDDRIERIMPYHPRIPLLDTNIVSKDVVLHGRVIVNTAPTALESTTLVIAHGLDLLVSKTTPGGAFDMMSSDYNYPIITIAIVALTAFTLTYRKKAMRNMAERKLK